MPGGEGVQVIGLELHVLQIENLVVNLLSLIHPLLLDHGVSHRNDTWISSFCIFTLDRVDYLMEEIALLLLIHGLSIQFFLWVLRCEACLVNLILAGPHNCVSHFDSGHNCCFLLQFIRVARHSNLNMLWTIVGSLDHRGRVDLVHRYLLGDLINCLAVIVGCVVRSVLHILLLLV